jgi:uncharacterized damage-inducible protein DinB
MTAAKARSLWNACLILMSGSSAALAQAPAATGTAPTTGARAEALRIIGDAGNKLTRLGEAIPAEKYAWRPAKDVRSVSEVLLHVAAGNYSITKRIGAEPPAGWNPQGFDKSTTDKAKVLEWVKKSFDHVKQAATKLTDADMEKTAPWFGDRQATYREILFFLGAHDHEHLGQTIAYARMNGITPPWTEEQQQRQKAQAQPKN